MKEPMIEIGQASESTIKALIQLGVLTVSENGIHVKEK